MNKKIIMIAAVAVLLLAGGGAGAYFYFMQPAEASVGEDGHEVAEHGKEEKKHAKKDSHGGGHGKEVAFVELDPLILPIVDSEGVSQTVSLVIAIEAADVDAAKEIEHMSPKLKDAFIQDMYGILNKHAAFRGGVLRVGILKKRLNKISVDVMGEDKVTDVLLQVVQQRPI